MRRFEAIRAGWEIIDDGTDDGPHWLARRLRDGVWDEVSAGSEAQLLAKIEAIPDELRRPLIHVPNPAVERGMATGGR